MVSDVNIDRRIESHFLSLCINRGIDSARIIDTERVIVE